MKVDNSYLIEKINLRIKAIESIQDPVVLECYSGYGRIWNEVSMKTSKKINILRIEKENNKCDKLYLPGDNRKYLKFFDLTKYNIIDLDAYGIPFDQLELIFKSNFKGIVIVTYIQSMMGKVPYKMLEKLGYSKSMINKIPTLFSKNGIEKIKNYLYLQNIQSIEGYFIGRKNYFMFNKIY